VRVGGALSGTGGANLHNGPYRPKPAIQCSQRRHSVASQNRLPLTFCNTSPFFYDGSSLSRRLATIDIDGRDVGEFLIEEKLARRWPDGDELWCQ
jgi:hypothetical protein